MNRLALMTGAAALVTAGCVVAVNDTDDDGGRGGGSWTRQATLVKGERALFDGGELEITLVDADDDEAELRIRDDSGQRTVEIRDTGRNRGIQWPPYRIWLSSADDDRATVVVSRSP